MARWFAGLAIACGLVTVACSSESDSNAADAAPPETLTWRPCGDVECAELRVPIDYAAPGAGMIPFAVNRVRNS